MFTIPRILLLLKGVLIGLFVASLFPLASLDIVLLFVAILILYWLLTLPALPDGWFAVGGAAVGVLLIVLATAISMTQLGGVNPALIVIALILLIIGD